MGDPYLYGPAHQAERRRWARELARLGSLPCASPSCLTPDAPIRPGDPWDLGHTTDRQGWRGPEHPRCNRRTATHRAIARQRPRQQHPGLGAAT